MHSRVFASASSAEYSRALCVGLIPSNHIPLLWGHGHTRRRQVEIQASDSNVADGMLHFVGIVVNQTTISFYKDSQLIR